MSTKSSGSRRSGKLASGKPPKPYPEFPLGPANNGRWCKKIRGRIHYFGRWGRVVDGQMTRIEGDGWQDALAIYKAQVDDIHAGRTPRPKDDEALTVKALCNEFRTAKYRKLNDGSMTARSYAEFVQTTDRIVEVFGGNRLVADLRPADFNRLHAKIQKGKKRAWGLVRLGNEITRVKSVFKFALGNGLIDKPMLFGTEFKRPEESAIRGERNASGKKQTLTADEIHRLLVAADVQMRAMLLVAVNCGFGNNDVATLPLEAVDLVDGWITYPRPKTKIDRRCPLWAETVRALREWLDVRPQPKQETAKDCVFVTARGRQWLSDVTTKFKDGTDATQRIAFPVVSAFSALTKRVGVHKKGIGFYVLRHVFRSQADGAKDWVATDRIMGHKDPTMGGHYRDTGSGIDDSRLVAVAQRVHDWLFPKSVEAPSDEPTKPKRQRKPKAGPVDPANESGPALRLFIA